MVSITIFSTEIEIIDVRYFNSKLNQELLRWKIK
jgi:hypothetical protein